MFGKNVDITAPGKLVVLAIVILGCFSYIAVATITGSGDTTPAWSMLTLVVGYLIGNGTGARKGIVTVPPLSPTPEKTMQYLQQEYGKEYGGS